MKYMLFMLVVGNNSVHFQQEYPSLTDCVIAGVRSSLFKPGYQIVCKPKDEPSYEESRK